MANSSPQPRRAITDPLQVYNFYLYDVAPIEAFSLPILSPLVGFSAITMPKITAELKEIKEANWYFSKKVVVNGSVDGITISRGVTFFNSDFYRWFMAGLTGDTGGISINSVQAFTGVGSIGGPTPRRTMVLIHFMARNPFGNGQEDGGAADAAAVAAIGTGLTTIAAMSGFAGGGLISGLQAAGQAAVGFSAAQASIGPFEFAPKIPARAWVLRGCLPTGYKPGSDFDASDSNVSIEELDISIESLEQLSLTSEL